MSLRLSHSILKTQTVWGQPLRKKIEYLKVERDERENQALQVLNQVIEDAKPLWIVTLLHV